MTEAPRAPGDENELRRLYAEGVRNFAGLKLSGADLAGCNLADVVLDRCSLGGADLTNATLIEASLVSARLTRAVLKDAKLWAACLDRANLVAADLGGASLVSARIREADLRDARFVGANLSGANLSHSRLVGAQLIGADIGGANLMGVDLAEAMAMEADLSGARLWHAQLGGADLRNAIMSGSSLIGAYLDGTNLLGAELAGADFSDATLTGARLDVPADELASATGCTIDAATYLASGWDPYTLAAWIDAGAELADPNAFPPEALDFVRSRGEGLTLYFRSPLETFDRFLLDAIIFAVLGPDTLARAVEVVPLESRGFVRVLAESNRDLDAIGQAIHGRAWESEDPPFLPGLLTLPAIYESLERLARRLDRIELRGIVDREPSTSGMSAVGEDDRPLTTLRRWLLR